MKKIDGAYTKSLSETRSGMTEKRYHLSFYWVFIIIITLLIAVCILLSKNTAFCDFYADHIFSFGIHTLGTVTGLFPFSVGEILIVLAVFLLSFQFLFVLFLFPLRKKMKYIKIVKRYSKTMLAVFLVVLWIFIMNCSTLYHCSHMNAGEGDSTEFEKSEIITLRNFIVERCNTLSEKMKRDENDNVVTTGDINEKVRAAMRQLSQSYPRLSGYYPNPKPIFGSFFMYQAGYDGVYFPFTLEANYNTYISDIRYPHVASHELAHLKGYIYEDEADFIAYLACTGSSDEQLQYAGYLGVLQFIDGDYWQIVQEDEIPSAPSVSERVQRDAASYTAVTYEDLANTKEIIDSEVVASASDEFTEAYMQYYDAEPNYAEVTKLLLSYYREKGSD